MSVCQRKTGAWLVKYKDAATGQWKQRQFKTKELAEEFDAAAKQTAEQNEPLSLREAVLVYLQNNTNLSDRRVDLYDYVVNGHDRKDGSHRQGPAEFLADRYAESLTRQDLEAMRQRLAADGLKPITINLYTGALKAALSWCEAEDLIALNPWRKYRDLSEGQLHHWSGTLEQLGQVYACLPEWARWPVRTAFALCLRPGDKELFALEWSAFDWKARTAAVYMPKTKRMKTVFLPDWYYPEALSRYEADTAAGQSLVCRGRKNRRILRTTYKYTWNGACRKAGVSIPPYSIRHIAASEMLCAGADIASIAAQLGHASVKTTAAFYLHALEKGQRQAAAALPCGALLVQNGADSTEKSKQK